MPTKKTRLKPDRHKGEKVSLNFPTSVMDAIRAMAVANSRTLTAEMTLALKAHIESNKPK
jgi:hypothetical protein